MRRERLISYEEYSPYGNTTYQAGRSAAEVSLKRYRYTGKERDEENGFTYHGARYCAAWLGRWTSCDPIGLKGGMNLYLYAGCNPVARIDPAGTDDLPAWYTEVTRGLDNASTSDIKSRLEALNAREGELNVLIDLNKPECTGSPLETLLSVSYDPQESEKIYRELSFIAHAKGELIGNLRMNWKRRAVIDGAERDAGKKWDDLSESAQNYYKMKLGHPEWQVPGNALIDQIVDESQSVDVQIFENAAFAGVVGPAMASPTEGGTPLNPLQTNRHLRLLHQASRLLLRLHRRLRSRAPFPHRVLPRRRQEIRHLRPQGADSLWALTRGRRAQAPRTLPKDTHRTAQITAASWVRPLSSSTRTVRPRFGSERTRGRALKRRTTCHKPKQEENRWSSLARTC